jgi:hypothetical protein
METFLCDVIRCGAEEREQGEKGARVGAAVDTAAKPLLWTVRPGKREKEREERTGEEEGEAFISQRRRHHKGSTLH